MRIIAGELGGLTFDAPQGHRTHPMSEKVRGGLFNTLGDIRGLTMLDGFAGSGALCFEAVSRGLTHATAVEIDRRAYHTLTKNITQLQLGHQIKAIYANVGAWSRTNPARKFDIVIAAPPYNDLQLNLVQKLTNHLKADGIFILDWPGKLVAPELAGMSQIKTNDYGDAQLVFYRPV